MIYKSVIHILFDVIVKIITYLEKLLVKLI